MREQCVCFLTGWLMLQGDTHRAHYLRDVLETSAVYLVG